MMMTCHKRQSSRRQQRRTLCLPRTYALLCLAGRAAVAAVAGASSRVRVFFVPPRPRFAAWAVAVAELKGGGRVWGVTEA